MPVDSTPFDNTAPRSVVNRRTVLIFPTSGGPRGGRLSVKEGVSSHKTTFEADSGPALLDFTSVEPDHNEDCDDGPSEEETGTWIDLSPDTERPPIKRSRKVDKATAVSPRFDQSCPFRRSLTIL